MFPETSNLIARHEGLRLSAYPDSLGNITVGYGIALTAPNGLALDEAVFLMLYRVFKIRIALTDTYNTKFTDLSDVRQAILTDCAYNMGGGNFEREIGPAMSGDALLIAHLIGQCEAAKINPARYAENATAFADDTLPAVTQNFDISPGIRSLAVA